MNEACKVCKKSGPRPQIFQGYPYCSENCRKEWIKRPGNAAETKSNSDCTTQENNDMRAILAYLVSQHGEITIPSHLVTKYAVENEITITHLKDPWITVVKVKSKE